MVFIIRTLLCATLLFAIVAFAPDARGQDVAPPLEDRARATECLTLAIAYEAGYESLEGQQAVAEVVLNRLHAPAFPKTVCDVVFAGASRRTGCQFTFTCDGSLYRRRVAPAVLAAARQIAEDALAGRTPARVPMATHYHADYVYPYWAPSLVRVAKIGAHIFYHAANTIAPLPGTSPGPTASAIAVVAKTPAPFAPWGLATPLVAAPMR